MSESYPGGVMDGDVVTGLGPYSKNLSALELASKVLMVCPWPCPIKHVFLSE